MASYTTALGDTWDKIAFDIYGSEKYTEQLMAANQDKTLLETVIFDAGVTISLPDIEISDDADADTLPPWRIT